MRILHTSDWHLGQHFMGYSRQAEHQALIDWLLTQVQTQAVDAVLIAGDIFDTGAPPSYARELYNQLVVRLHGVGVALLLLGGNHDSVATLGESRALLAVLSTTVVAAVGGPAGQAGRQSRRDGEAGGRHNPEFTMLEWYRVGWTLEPLMDETVALVQAALSMVGRSATVARVSFRDLYRQQLGVDPMTADLETVRNAAAGIAIDTRVLDVAVENSGDGTRRRIRSVRHVAKNS